jgi:hypothetical protein
LIGHRFDTYKVQSSGKTKQEFFHRLWLSTFKLPRN